MAETHTSIETGMADEAHQSATNAAAESGEKETNIKERKVSWAKLRRVDSLNKEAGELSFKPTHHASRQVISSSFSSSSSCLFLYKILIIVYGLDLAKSK